jgi:hypothetical protein
MQLSSASHSLLLLRVRAFLRLSKKKQEDRVIGTGSGSANPTLLATMLIF